jgi:CubicO group peptidase (beta-lactamase class C family)
VCKNRVVSNRLDRENDSGVRTPTWSRIHNIMKVRHSAPLSLSLLLAIVSAASSQKLSPPPDAKAQVDRIFGALDHKDGPGCAIGVGIDASTVLAAAYGMADLEHNVPLTPETVFEAGSVTKQFTAASVLLLVQQGELSLDDLVRKYIPELPDYGSPITIRHLLNHTSGLRDWRTIAAIAGRPSWTNLVYSNADTLEMAARQRALNYVPGSEYSYTNTGFNLLAILVGRVGGKPLPEFSREAIFVPLAMTSTGWRDDFHRIVPNRAVAYAQDGTGFRTFMPFETAYGNGGLLTTVGDLLRWNRNFTEKKVGGRSFTDAQLQQGRLSDGRVIAYAAGLMVLQWRGLPEVSHAGDTAGYHAWLGRYPQQGLSIALLCNGPTSSSPTQLGHQVADVYLKGALSGRSEASRSVVSPAALTEKTGLYRSVRDHRTLSVELANGELALLGGARVGGETVLKPLSFNAFTAGEDGRRVEFETDASSKVLRLHFDTVADEGNVYEKVEPAHPSRTDLEAMTGEYTSDEAETALRVTLDGGQLVMLQRPDHRIPLMPTYRDGFSSSLGSVRFLRDATGRVTELSIGSQRVWDIRFHRGSAPQP